MYTSVCVFDWRYGSDEMRRNFSLENIVKRYIDVERALVKGLSEAGLIERSCVEEVVRCLESLDIESVVRETYTLEERLGHEIASLVQVLTERCGECGRYIHLGATSNDIIDTAWILIIRDALGLVKKRLREVIERLIEYSRRYRDLVMVGRTHGQHALPITLGFKFSNYVYELSRSYERICDLEKRLVRGKISGAVGTMAAWRDRGLVVEETVMRELGLRPHLVTTQVAPRDGYAEMASVFSILASQIDRLALEVRELSRTEIRELYEAVERVGSSTMPHKRNPVTAERLSGLARYLRSLTVSFAENIVLMHERDLSNSSFERISIPHMFLAVDQMLLDTKYLLDHLGVDENSMRQNLEMTRGAIMSESIMVRLVERGVPRTTAHRRLMELSREAEREGLGLREVLMRDELVTRHLSPREIEEALDPSRYLGSYKEIIERALEYARSVLETC